MLASFKSFIVVANSSFSFFLLSCRPCFHKIVKARHVYRVWCFFIVYIWHLRGSTCSSCVREQFNFLLYLLLIFCFSLLQQPVLGPPCLIKTLLKWKTIFFRIFLCLVISHKKNLLEKLFDNFSHLTWHELKLFSPKKLLEKEKGKKNKLLENDSISWKL